MVAKLLPVCNRSNNRLIPTTLCDAFRWQNDLIVQIVLKSASNLFAFRVHLASRLANPSPLLKGERTEEVDRSLRLISRAKRLAPVIILSCFGSPK
jgi:hypothetical protein